MLPRLKPLHRQTMVITGATSGIGLVVARRAAARGCRVVLAARNEGALRRLREEIRDHGGQAEFVVADVGKESDVERIAQGAIEAFGGFDTWDNNAAVSIYGRIEDVSIADMHRLFDTNFWGVVYGSRAAVRQFRRQGGGKLINMGSVLGERAIPIQGIYAASKAAIARFTGCLRLELYADGTPVSVTLIKPSAIDTPYKDHAKNYMPEAPKNPPPVYAPEVVARAVLYAAEHHVRDLVAGFAGKGINLAAAMAPTIADRIEAKVMPYLQRSDRPADPDAHDSLYHPGEDLHERGGYDFTLEHSAYTAARTHPGVTAALAVGLGAAAGYLALRRS